LLNEDLIVLVRDSTCASNMYYQLGNECSPATMNPKFTSSTTASGVKGYEVTVEYSGPCIQLYEGSVTGAVLPDGFTGELITMGFDTDLVQTLNGVEVTAAVLDADTEFSFTSQQLLGLPLKTMQIKVATDVIFDIEFDQAYLGKVFSMKDLTGANHSGYFTPGYLTVY
jgi:hypothetical protein